MSHDPKLKVFDLNSFTKNVKKFVSGNSRFVTSHVSKASGQGCPRHWGPGILTGDKRVHSVPLNTTVSGLVETRRETRRARPAARTPQPLAACERAGRSRVVGPVMSRPNNLGAQEALAGQSVRPVEAEAHVLIAGGQRRQAGVDQRHRGDHRRPIR